MKTRRAFGMIEILIVAFTLILIGFVTYMFVSKMGTTSQSQNSATTVSSNASYSAETLKLTIPKLSATMNFPTGTTLTLDTEKKGSDTAYYEKFDTGQTVEYGESKAVITSIELISRDYVVIHQDDCTNTQCSDTYALETGDIFDKLKSSFAQNTGLAEGATSSSVLVDDGSFSYYAMKLNDRVWLYGYSGVPGMKYASLVRYVTFVGDYQVNVNVLCNTMSIADDLSRTRAVLSDIILTNS